PETSAASLHDALPILRRERLLTDLRQRIRHVAQGPDGLLYLLTDENDAAVLRIEPVGAEASTSERGQQAPPAVAAPAGAAGPVLDRKSTRLNSSHVKI